jgi:hypothetical protein
VTDWTVAYKEATLIGQAQLSTSHFYKDCPGVTSQVKSSLSSLKRDCLVGICRCGEYHALRRIRRPRTRIDTPCLLYHDDDSERCGWTWNVSHRINHTPVPVISAIGSSPSSHSTAAHSVFNFKKLSVYNLLGKLIIFQQRRVLTAAGRGAGVSK